MTNQLIVFDFAGTLVCMRPPKLLVNRSLLKRLSQVYLLGILTGGSRTEVINILKKLKILPYFKDEIIITKSDTKFRKPNPKLLSLVIQGSKATTCLYIGDSVKDYKMSTTLGIPFIYIGKKRLGVKQFMYPQDINFEDISEIYPPPHSL